MRVLLIDDHALVRRGIGELLQSRGVHVAASVSSGEEGVRRAVELHPDIILLDVKMPGVNGIETVQRLRAAGVSAPVVMLTMSREDAELGAALRAGAQGYLLKDMEPEELLPALEAVLRGESVVAGRWSERSRASCATIQARGRRRRARPLRSPNSRRANWRFSSTSPTVPATR